MKPESLCGSMEACHLLRTFGVSQDSAFYWVQEPTHERKWVLKSKEEVYFFIGIQNAVAALNVAELGVVLNWEWLRNITKNEDGTWKMVPPNADSGGAVLDPIGTMTLETEAEARVQMLGFLLANGIMKVAEVSKRLLEAK